MCATYASGGAMTEMFPQYAQRGVAAISRHEGGSLLRRWLGCWIDLVMLCVPPFLVGVIGAMAGTEPGPGAWSGVVGILWIIYIPAYFLVMETLWGRTVGKFVAGTIVLTSEGELPGFWRVLIRTVFRLIEVNPILLGGVPAGIAVLATPNKQRLGDLAAGTYVIPVARRPSAGSADAKLAEVF
jgi:uncharacterized RDD family membrane protein YckC